MSIEQKIDYYCRLARVNVFRLDKKHLIIHGSPMLDLFDKGNVDVRVEIKELFYGMALLIHEDIDWVGSNSVSNPHNNRSGKAKSEDKRLVFIKKCLITSCNSGHEKSAIFLGTIYFNQKKYTEAREVLQLGLNSQDIKIRASANELMGKMHILDKQYLEAKPYLEKVLVHDKSFGDNLERQVYTNNFLGMISCVELNYAQAKAHFKFVTTSLFKTPLRSSAATMLACIYHCELNYSKVKVYLTMMRESPDSAIQALADDLGKTINNLFLNEIQLELDGGMPIESTVETVPHGVVMPKKQPKVHKATNSSIQQKPYIIKPNLLVMKSEITSELITDKSSKEDIPPTSSATITKHGRKSVSESIINPIDGLRKIIDGEVQEIAKIGKVVQVRGRKIFVIIPHDLLEYDNFNKNNDYLGITSGSGGQGIKFFNHTYTVNGNPGQQCSEIKQLGAHGDIRTLMVAVDDSKWEKKLPGKFLIPMFWGKKSDTVKTSGELSELLKKVDWSNNQLDKIITVLGDLAKQLNLSSKSQNLLRHSSSHKLRV